MEDLLAVHVMLVSEASDVPPVTVAPAEPLIVVGAHGAANENTALKTFVGYKGEEPEQVLRGITPDTQLGPVLGPRLLVLLDLAEFTNEPWRQMGTLLRLVHQHTPRRPISIDVSNHALGGDLVAHMLRAAGALKERGAIVSVCGWEDKPMVMPIDQMPVLPHRAELEAFTGDTAARVPGDALDGLAYNRSGDGYVLAPVGAMLQTILAAPATAV
ncbi:hypothetical protein [Nocardiopsis sp. LOL_012]|uniref:hypothetical protein n=1 Tax=Nocardiopsis sp. LOL_012 TaxID=3345409 RepID=UPI003A85368E